MRATINKNEYLFSHGKEPRGKGQWWFDIKYSNGQAFREMRHGFFTNALKEIRRSFPGAWEIIVMP